MILQTVPIPQLQVNGSTEDLKTDQRLVDNPKPTEQSTKSTHHRDLH